MEGFLRISLPPWQRRMVTRLVAMVPAAIVAGVAGNRGAGKLLVLSQVGCHVVQGPQPLTLQACSQLLVDAFVSTAAGKPLLHSRPRGRLLLCCGKAGACLNCKC